MKRITSILLLTVIVCFLSVPAWSAFYGPYSVTSPTAIDGDTLRVKVTIWPTLSADVAVRVRGVDTPELRGATQCERDKAIAAKAFTAAWITANAPIIIGMVASDTYKERVDAVVTGKNGESLADALIKSGHGRAYNDGARQPWCQTGVPL